MRPFLIPALSLLIGVQASRAAGSEASSSAQAPASGGPGEDIVLLRSDQYPDSLDKVKTAVHKADLGSLKDTLPIQVQVMHDGHGKPRYFVAYLLSSKDYSFKIVKIEVDQDYLFKSTTRDYPLTAEDLKGESGEPPPCPDPSVDFVAATSEEGIPSAMEAVNRIEALAKAAGAHTARIVGEKATARTYLSYMKCPLKGFFSVGHGSPQGLMLKGGMLSSDKIKAAKLGSAVVLFNSCEVFNDPFKSAVNAGAYGGGVSELAIGPSEEASKCFWADVLNQQPIKQTLDRCNEHKDPGDVWGIKVSGSNTMGKAGGSSRTAQTKSLADIGSASVRFE